MTITVYRWDDPGAPVLPNSIPRSFDSLRTILMACLVDGYEGKPAAGWTVGHDVADGFSLSNGEGFISFWPAIAQSIRFYLMEAITDPTTAIPGGVNRRSGKWYDGSPSTHFHYLYLPYYYANQATKNWIVVADGKTVHAYFYARSAEVDARTNDGVSLSFGRYFPPVGDHGFYVCGGAVNGSTSTTAQIASPSYSPGTSLRNPHTGAIDQGVDPGYRLAYPMEGSNASVVAKQVKPLGRAACVRVSLAGVGPGISGSASATTTVNCGLARGLVAIPPLTDMYLSRALQALGVDNPQPDDKFRELTLPGGKKVVPFWTHTSDLGAFISLDPADWE